MINAQPQQKSQSINYQDPQNLEIILQFEMKKALLYGPSLGIYLLPSLDNPKKWNGLIFVRHGYYKSGKFKFDILFDKFPAQAPSVFFNSKLFHPLVNLNTGQLDVSTLLRSQWNYPDEAMVYTLITSINHMFCSHDHLSEEKSFNTQAAKLFIQNSNQFAFQALKSVEESLTCLQTEEQCNSISLETIPETENKAIRQQLADICAEEGSIDSKIDKFMNILNK